jgi:hypothetical protein
MNKHAEFQIAIDSLLKESLELRFGSNGDEKGIVFLPSPQDGPEAILDSLARTRKRLDRLEEVYSKLIRLKGSASRRAEEAKAVFEEAWEASSSASRSRPVVKGDFTAPRERYADLNLQHFELKRASRAAAELLSKASEAEQVVRLLHRGLDSLRYDHIAMLNGMNVLANLER